MVKKSVLVLLLIAAVVGSAAAADVDWKAYPESVEKGNILVNAGIGFGTPLYGDLAIPPIQASVDYAFLSPFTLGGVFGFTTSHYDIVDITYTGMAFGGRFGYHPNFGVPKLAVSANATLGYYLFKASADDVPGVTLDYSTFLFGVNVDVRYFFTENLGIFAEVGYSALSFVSGGVVLKF
jgi:hypothetical protein